MAQSDDADLLPFGDDPIRDSILSEEEMKPYITKHDKGGRSEYRDDAQKALNWSLMIEHLKAMHDRNEKLQAALDESIAREAKKATELWRVG